MVSMVLWQMSDRTERQESNKIVNDLTIDHGLFRIETGMRVRFTLM